MRIRDGKNSDPGSAPLLQYTCICCGTYVVSHHCKQYEMSRRTLSTSLGRQEDFLYSNSNGSSIFWSAVGGVSISITSVRYRAMFRIRIRIILHFRKPDTEPHQSQKPDPDPYQHQKVNRDTHQSQNSGAVEVQNEPILGSSTLTLEAWRLKMELWMVCRQIAGSRHSDKERDPDPSGSRTVQKKKKKPFLRKKVRYCFTLAAFFKSREEVEGVVWLLLVARSSTCGLPTGVVAAVAAAVGGGLSSGEFCFPKNVSRPTWRWSSASAVSVAET